MLSIGFDQEVTRDFERSSGLEWLETNGLGGWAGGTVAGVLRRRYHGLLVAADETGGRTVLVSKLDETLHAGGESFELSCNQFPGALVPCGYEYLTGFQKELFPVFEYEAGGVRLRKTVAAVGGENTTLVLYEVLEAPGPFLLSLRPFLAGRDHHALASADGTLSETVSFADGTLRLRPHGSEPGVFLRVPGADFRPGPAWYHRFEYEADRERGFDYQEDLWTPGLFGVELAAGGRLGIVVSIGDPAGRDAFALLARERKRREKVLAALPAAPEESRLVRALALAADGFLVGRGAGRSVVAGYPWFGERDRDTLIALPGICLATGRFDDARKILRSLSRNLDSTASIDAPLWLFVAVYKLLQATGDEAFVRTLLPALRKAVRACDGRVDEDGLLAAVDPETPLTWMDGRIGGRPVTPRSGKPVEVEALWYNAVAILAELETRLGDPQEGERLAKRAKRVQKRFGELFWNEEAGCLFDVVDGVNGEVRDASLRPNQVFALSLPFPLLPKARAARVLAAIEEHLATPVGLRSLAPGEPGYRPSYTGGPVERELAYHQGTVWSWLLGPYLTALTRVQGPAGRKKARQLFADLEPRLAEAGLGSLSEVYDAEPPHAPRGCIARAWTVGELLRAWSEDLRQAPGAATMAETAATVTAMDEAPVDRPAKAPRKARSRKKTEA
jgi:predicted glycogen debranching enzyme